MPSADQLRNRLGSYEDLRSIVRTMKALSAASIRQYEASAASLQDYDRTVGLALRAVRDRVQANDPTPAIAGKGPAVLVAFGSTHGLCGRINEDVAALAATRARALAERSVSLVTVGARLAQVMARLGLATDVLIDAPGSVTGINSVVQDIMLAAGPILGDADTGTMSVVYARRKGTSSYRAVCRQLLPSEQSAGASDQLTWPRRTRPMLPLPAPAMLHQLRQQQLFTAVFRACAEAQASEHASRLVAMTSAERNVEDRICEVAAEARHLRQDAITAELLDVVAGYEALRS